MTKKKVARTLTAKQKILIQAAAPVIGMLDQAGIQDCLDAYNEIPDEIREQLDTLHIKLSTILKVSLYLGWEAGVKSTLDTIAKGLLDDMKPEGNA